MESKELITSGIIELYVMGLCSPDEEREVEQLRRQNPEIAAAITRYEEQLEKNMLQKATLPPAAVDDRILKKLESLQGAAVIEMTGKTQTPLRKLTWLKAAAAACFILLAVSAWFNLQLHQKNKALTSKVAKETIPTLPAADYAIITNPSITPVAMYGQGFHSICRCTMFWDKKTGKTYVFIHHLPQSNEAKDYQLWAEVNGQQVSVGIINDSIRGKLIELSGVPADATAFIVTLEKAGGSTSPDLSDIYLKGKI
jgi:anti-sigma-K factor RskA